MDLRNYGDNTDIGCGGVRGKCTCMFLLASYVQIQLPCQGVVLVVVVVTLLVLPVKILNLLLSVTLTANVLQPKRRLRLSLRVAVMRNSSQVGSYRCTLHQARKETNNMLTASYVPVTSLFLTVVLTTSNAM